ncbi:MAG: hypothetical protein ONB15_13070 [candidate division KSB1 bacterium]|nr:hypothetical protein [candidate division KSB1 bacterium]
MDAACRIERTLREVRLSEIDLEDGFYRVSWGPALSGLAMSLGEIGLVNPPTLQRRADGMWRIVCGFRRCELLARLGCQQVQAWCVDKNAPPLGLFVQALCDNVGGRVLNAVECATALAKLHAQFGVGQEEIVQRYLPLLGLPRSTEVFQRYVAMARLGEPMRRWLAEDRLSHEVALRLAAKPEGEANAIFHVISELRLGKNQQRILLRLLEDLARQRSCTMEAIVTSPESKGVLQSADLTPTQRAERLFAWLRAQRFPHLAAAERKAQELVRQMNLPPNVRMTPPPHFEGEDWQCTMHFSSVEALREAARRLAQVAECPVLQEALALP